MNEYDEPQPEGPEPVCPECGRLEVWDCGMATESGWGWFCAYCGLLGVTLIDLDGNEVVMTEEMFPPPVTT